MAFFAKGYLKPELNHTAVFIYVGKDPFHAAAVALIDALKQGASLDDTSSKKIVDGFILYFPKFLHSQPYSTPLDRMKTLLNNSGHMSEIVDGMAYVLRQLAVDVIVADPNKYQEAINGLHAQTLLADLRNPSIMLPVSALDALTQILEIQWISSIVVHEKEIRALEVYPEEDGNVTRMGLKLQEKESIAFPKVKDKKEYAYVGHMPLRTPKIPPNFSESETIAPLLEQIDSNNKRIGIVYEQTRKTLLAMVAAGELTKKQLIDLRVAFLPKQDRLYTEEFFSKLEQKDKMPVPALSFNSAEQHDIELLVNSLAGWISTKQIDEDQLFERIAPMKAMPYS